MMGRKHTNKKKRNRDGKKLSAESNIQKKNVFFTAFLDFCFLNFGFIHKINQIKAPNIPKPISRNKNDIRSDIITRQIIYQVSLKK
jgi:hypothetical protein